MKRRKEEGLILFDFKAYSKAILIKIVWYSFKDWEIYLGTEQSPKGTHTCMGNDVWWEHPSNSVRIGTSLLTYGAETTICQYEKTNPALHHIQT